MGSSQGYRPLRDILRFFLLIAVSLALVIFLVEKIQGPDLEGETVSIPQEESYSSIEQLLGELSLESILAEYKQIRNEHASLFFEELHRIFMEGLGPDADSMGRIEYILIDDGRVNAFALPAGQIIVTRGLVDDVESLDELAAVLAHELGHVRHKHVMKKLKGDAGLTLFLVIVTGGDAGGAMTRILQSLVSSGYSRKLEIQADEFSVRLLHCSGMDPAGLIRFFERIEARRSEILMLPEIISSHPDTQKRIESIRLQIESSEWLDCQPQRADLPRLEQVIKTLSLY